MDNLYTVRQIAFILKVHPLTVRRYLREGKLAAVRISGSVRIKEEALENFQRAYTRNVRRLATRVERDTSKIFSLDDPLWRLEGVGGSLSLPKD